MPVTEDKNIKTSVDLKYLKAEAKPEYILGENDSIFFHSQFAYSCCVLRSNSVMLGDGLYWPAM